MGSIWDRANRNGINDNFQYLFQQAGKVNDAIAQAQKAINEANRVNGLNKDVQKQIDDLIIDNSTSDAEVVQARGEHGILRERFEDIERKRADYVFSSNNTQPSKKGLLTNSYKVVRKIDADNMEVFQKTSKGYLRYHFRQNSGGTGYGVNYELLRVINVEPISDVVVFSHAGSPTVGSVTPTFSFENPHNTTTVRNFFERYKADNTVSYNNDKILQPYTISGSSSVTYSLAKPTNKKMNVSFFFRNNYSNNNDSVNVYVNNRFARTIDINDSFAQGIQNFDIPVYTRDTNTSNPLEVRIENTTSNDVYIVGFNLFKLGEYNGEGVDSFIAIGSTLHPFISNSGASDYAMMNAENNSNFGSFHGGEKSNRCDVLWRNGTADTSVYRSFSGIATGDFTVTEYFALKQITVLIERAYMHSNMNWNTDGTLQMDFSYQAFLNQENIPFADFWTALTCTDPNFTILRQPVYQDGRSSSGHRFFKSTDGYVIQESTSGTQELHSRFTRFNNEFVRAEEANSISYQTQYNKHYYAPIRYYRDTSKPVAPDVLQFSKGLDFYVY